MGTKQCTVCKRILPLTEFYKRGNGRLRSECKTCHINSVKKQYKSRKEITSAIKAEKGCQKCGEMREYVLDFHHVDPAIKDGTIARWTSNRNKVAEILNEIDKCVVLCSNCHREFHYLEAKEHITLEEYLKK